VGGQEVKEHGISRRLGFHGASVVFRTFVGVKALLFCKWRVDEFVPNMQNLVLISPSGVWDEREKFCTMAMAMAFGW
jgi:hypothetical protein